MHIWLEILPTHKAIINSYLILQNWCDQVDGNIANKYIDDKHKDESTHAYNADSGENLLYWQQFG